MEQRNCERKVVSLDAVVGCARFGLIRGRITDLAHGGLYIRAETSIVPIGAEVTVTFNPGEDFCDSSLTANGRVSHQSLHGFGIEFDPLEPCCREALDRFLPTMTSVPQRAAPILRAI